jgi:transketolase
MGLSEREKTYLRNIAANVRADIIEMTCHAGSGHPGGSLSAVEILTVLYHKVLRVDPKNPKCEDRDRFVLSKGHAAAALYAVLMERGFFPREEMRFFRQIGGNLQGHPNMLKVPGVDMSTGSLGQGLSVAVGMALGAKLQERNFGVYALIGCGESQEGQIWEAAMAAAQFNLDNLIAIMDNNQVQLDGNTRDIMNIEPVEDKWRSFRWEVFSCDGHDFAEIHSAIEKARSVTDKPSIIIARTIKGKGISFMENSCKWHGVLDLDRFRDALKEVGRNVAG